MWWRECWLVACERVEVAETDKLLREILFFCRQRHKHLSLLLCLPPPPAPIYQPPMTKCSHHALNYPEKPPGGVPRGIVTQKLLLE